MVGAEEVNPSLASDPSGWCVGDNPSHPGVWMGTVEEGEG